MAHAHGGRVYFVSPHAHKQADAVPAAAEAASAVQPPLSQKHAHRLPINADAGTPIENDLLVGSVALLHRPTSKPELEKQSYAYRWHFGDKTRLWELRLQVRFKALPAGPLYGGMCLEDFNYAKVPSAATRALAAVGVPLLRRTVGQEVFFSWGDRGEDAERNPDHEKMMLVGSWTGWDQVIVSKAGDEAPPSLCGDLTPLGVRRNAMKLEAYKAKVDEVLGALNTSDTYTLCFWGCSRFADLLNWKVRNILPMGMPLDKALGHWPVHFTLFSSADTGRRHGDAHRQVYLDLMAWPLKLDSEIQAKLTGRYTYHEAGVQEDRD